MDVSQLRNKLAAAVNNLVTLEIVTVLSSDINLDQKETAKGQALRTRIRLDQGDIITEIDPAFITDPVLAPVLDLHKERELQAQAIVKGNIEVLKAFAAFIKDMDKEAEAAGDAPTHG